MKIKDLKKGLVEFQKAKAATATKKVRREIDPEKAASALLNEPASVFDMASDDADAGEVIKNLAGRVESIRALMEKAHESEGRIFVMVDEDDTISKEFEMVVKSEETKKDEEKPEKPEGEETKKDEGSENPEGEKIDTAKADDSWPLDMVASDPSRMRRLTKSEQITSTDPSHRRDVRKAKRDRKRAGERCMSAGE